MLISDATVPSLEQLHWISACNASFREASRERETIHNMNGERGNFVTLYSPLKGLFVSTGFLAFTTNQLL